MMPFPTGPDLTRWGVCALTCACLSLPAAAENWQPVPGGLMTPWADQVSPDAVHREYPRPQLVRQQWQNLNGLWQYAIRSTDAERPDEWDGQILVPFAVESALSGVGTRLQPDQCLWYRTTFRMEDDWAGQALLLHFEGADWETTAWVNGRLVGEHRGGYDPFSLDITHAVRPDQPQELVVRVWDPTDAGFQPRGKQVRQPHGIWYTPVTGIWQTVWLEPVPHQHIRSLRMVPDVDDGTLRIQAETARSVVPTRLNVAVTGITRGDQLADSPQYSIAADEAAPSPAATVSLSEPRLWSPDQPWLYQVQVELVGADGAVLDQVKSYFGLRKIELGKDSEGVNRLLLNNKPLFHFGLLDQGWWPDGLYTAPTDQALRYDLEETKRLGYNMCRKHVKIEPRRWYYHCDRLGLMVWQDMPSGDRYIGANDEDIQRVAQSERTFRREYRALIESRFNHPSIVVWVPFNEGWGQFQTNAILQWTKQLDATRLVDGPSGWTDRGGGDLHDIHRYPGPGMPELEEDRAVVLGEFGGLGWPVDGHLWQEQDNWGYRTYRSQDELVKAYVSLMQQLKPLVARGLAAAVYTQTTDVEIEVNGIMTYDRRVTKLPDQVIPLHQALYEAPGTVKPIVPTSVDRPQSWRYTLQEPNEGWTAPAFDDSSWKEGPGGFGREGTPGAVVRTAWETDRIWLRRTFDYSGSTPSGQLYLVIHHDEEAEVFLNGRQIASLEGYTANYVWIPLDKQVKQWLRQGNNTLAVHCRQTEGGQYIDVGLQQMLPSAAVVDEKSDE